MAKQSGLGDNFYVGGYDLSGDINSLNRIGGGPAVLEVTGIDKSAYERVGGRRDGSIEFVSYFNKASGRAFPVLKALPTTDVVTSYFRGTTLGNPAAGLVGKQPNYDGSRDDNGNFQFSAQMLANGYGVQWGKSLTAGVRTDTTATNGTGVDFGTGSTSYGLQAFLHVFAFTGTSVTIKLQESSDDGAGDSWADVTDGGFTTVTGIGAERIATADDQTVERYLRVVTSGTFSNVQFAVLVVRNDTAVSF